VEKVRVDLGKKSYSRSLDWIEQRVEKLMESDEKKKRGRGRESYANSGGLLGDFSPSARISITKINHLGKAN